MGTNRYTPSTTGATQARLDAGMVADALTQSAALAQGRPDGRRPLAPNTIDYFLRAGSGSTDTLAECLGDALVHVLNFPNDPMHRVRAGTAASLLVEKGVDRSMVPRAHTIAYGDASSLSGALTSCLAHARQLATPEPAATAGRGGRPPTAIR